ncbi:MAG: hypothetical protein BWY52_02738 [Chloroflexi bacterium ADurb.Bin325]|nr:MAG: hypothetical protein BWY52_02738 [Chloroflexi bacterium ADurb.Bin325]
MLGKLWRNRKWVKDALAEIGCGLLTMLLVTIPLWVITLASRGPGFALSVLAGLLVVFLLLVVTSKAFRRR